MTGRQALTIAHTAMTPKQFDAFLLIYVQELSYHEAGTLLHLDPDAVRKRVDRGIHRITLYIGRHHEPPAPSPLPPSRTRSRTPRTLAPGRPRHTPPQLDRQPTP